MYSFTILSQIPKNTLFSSRTNLVQNLVVIFHNYINMNGHLKNIITSVLSQVPLINVVRAFDGLKCFLDTHAPLKTKTFVQSNTLPWYNQAIQYHQAIQQEKRDRSSLERL